jgi:hypothetical protein
MQTNVMYKGLDVVSMFQDGSFPQFRRMSLDQAYPGLSRKRKSMR